MGRNFSLCLHVELRVVSISMSPAHFLLPFPFRVTAVSTRQTEAGVSGGRADSDDSRGNSDTSASVTHASDAGGSVAASASHGNGGVHGVGRGK